MELRGILIFLSDQHDIYKNKRNMITLIDRTEINKQIQITLQQFLVFFNNTLIWAMLFDTISIILMI